MMFREGERVFSLEAEVLADGRVSLETHNRHDVGYAATKKAMTSVLNEISRVLREGDENCPMSTEKTVPPSPNDHVVDKLWGTEVWHHNDEHYCMKTLTLNLGYMSSMHRHIRKRETFLVVSGTVQLEYGSLTFTFMRGQSFDIAPGVYHRFRALTPTATVIEASTTHSDDDVDRLEKSCKLVKEINAGTK